MADVCDIEQKFEVHNKSFKRGALAAWEISSNFKNIDEVSTNSNIVSDKTIILIYLVIQNDIAYKVNLKHLEVSIIMLVLQPKFLFNAYHLCGNYV